MTKITFGTNITAARVQRQLSIATEGFSSTSERLASGQRINRPSDDAAGLAIATSLNTDKRVLGQAVRNLNDGLSALGIAEAAMGSLEQIIGRIQELSTQAMSGTFGSTQRQSMQREVTALQSEWNRIVDSTSFNGSALLTGSNTRTVLQGGRGINNVLAVQIGSSVVSEAFGLQSAGTTTRVSTTASGAQANDASVYGTISGDGRIIAFDSFASNIISGASGRQVYARNLQTGEVMLISRSASGAAGNANSRDVKISTDGGFASFDSVASNLISGVSGSQIYHRNLSTGALQVVSTSSSGTVGNGTSLYSTVSGDGRYVAFSSNSTNLIGGVSGSQIYVKDTVTGSLTLASSSSSGATGNALSDRAVISDDGRYVVFESDATNLVAGATGRQTYVKDLVTGQVRVASQNAQGTNSTGGPFHATINATGRYVAFSSNDSTFLPGLSGTNSQVFLKDLETGSLTLVTTASSGVEGNGSSYDAVLSPDARYIAFRSTATNIIAGVSGSNIYRKDLLTGAVELVSRSTDGTVANADSYVGDKIRMTADGRKILFHSSATNLISGDTNGDEDVFLRDMSKAGIQQLAGMVITDIGGARATSNLITQYRDELSMHRSAIGTSTSRIGSFIANVSAMKANYTEAAARIEDADIAQEVAAATASRIKQDISTALLSQASRVSDIALQLLRV